MATECCFLVAQDTKQGPRKWAIPEVLFLSTKNLSKLEGCITYTSSWLYPWITSRALFLVTVPNSSSLFRNTHLVPIIDLFSSRGTRCHTLFLSNWWSSSCIAVIKSEFWCFHGRGVNGSTDTLSTLAEILSEQVQKLFPSLFWRLFLSLFLSLFWSLFSTLFEKN